MTVKRAAVLLLGLLCVLPGAPARASATQLLARVFRAPRAAAYTGVLRVTVTTPASTATVQVRNDGRGNELREHLDGAARGLAVFADGRTTWLRLPGESRWTAQSTAPRDPDAWARLCRNYRFQTLRRERVAGREAAVIALTPRHPGNPRQVIWVDTAQAIILRNDSYDYDGKLRLKSVFTALTINKPGAALSHPTAATAAAARFYPASERGRVLGAHFPLPARMPPGYTLTGFSLRQCRCGKWQPAFQYEDGLNTLTLFVTNCCGERRGRGWGWGWGRRRRQGCDQAGSCLLTQTAGQQIARLGRGEYTYILVGDHQPSALADALRSLE